MSGSNAGDRRAPADARPEGIRGLLQSSAAAPGDRAQNPGAKGAATWGAKDKQGNRIPRIARAAPRLPLGCRLGQRWPKKRADQRGSQHRGMTNGAAWAGGLAPASSVTNRQTRTPARTRLCFIIDHCRKAIPAPRANRAYVVARNRTYLP